MGKKKNSELRGVASKEYGAPKDIEQLRKELCADRRREGYNRHEGHKNNRS